MKQIRIDTNQEVDELRCTHEEGGVVQKIKIDKENATIKHFVDDIEAIDYKKRYQSMFFYKDGELLATWDKTIGGFREEYLFCMELKDMLDWYEKAKERNDKQIEINRKVDAYKKQLEQGIDAKPVDLQKPNDNALRDLVWDFRVWQTDWAMSPDTGIDDFVKELSEKYVVSYKKNSDR